MPLTLQQYAEYLDSRDLSWPAAPDVDRPKARPHLAALPDVRAVTWSVYGTLLAIVGGELYFEHPQKFIMDIALDKTLQEFKMWGSMTRKPGQPSEYLGQLYRKALENLRLVPSPGEKFPEIVSEQIWEDIVKKLLQKEYHWDVNFFGSLNEYTRKIAYFFHASLQGTACYDGVWSALQHVTQSGRIQGLIDNGQVFTPVQLERGLQQQNKSARLEDVIDTNLCVLSSQLRARKPSEQPFCQVLETLGERGIDAAQVLHIGSSITRDIIPAKRLGMRTALFAGDKHSLEATPEQLKEAVSRPDVLLTEVMQIAKILPG